MILEELGFSAVRIHLYHLPMVDVSSLGDNLESTSNDSASTTRAYPTSDDLLERCNLLISELETFKEQLKAKRQDHTVEIAHFRNTVKSEKRTLQRLADNAQSEQAAQHTVNSSNLPFLETIWTTVKNTTGLQALQKRFYWHGGLSRERAQRQAIAGRSASLGLRITDKKKQSALVDIVSQDGLEWIKVSLITNTRLLFDKAKQGWEEDSSEEEEDEDDDGSKVGSKLGVSQSADDDGEDDIPLIRTAKEMIKAAKTVRIRTKHPQIRLVLPRIEEGQIEEIDAIIATLRGMGCIVQTADHPLPSPPLEEVLDNILTDPFATLTDTLNIDCTILLALVSDFSHCSVEAEPWFHRALKRQVEIEDKENLLPNLLYPAIAGHELICTREAEKRMHEIVDTIGTPGEKARTKYFMGTGDDSTAADINDHESLGKNLRDQLQEWSKFEVPPTLHLPIKVVESGVQLSDTEPGTFHTRPNDDMSCDSTSTLNLPLSAKVIKENLTWINQSVFLHGWANDRSTITSNRTVVKQIENLLATHADSEKEWPKIWLCPTARSLVGKEKGRRE